MTRNAKEKKTGRKCDTKKMKRKCDTKRRMKKMVKEKEKAMTRKMKRGTKKFFLK
jgi:hypothetical protein